MGCHKNIDIDKFPKQSGRVGQKTEVCFRYNPNDKLDGEIIRDDVEEPFMMLFRLTDGRIVSDLECQWKYVPEKITWQVGQWYKRDDNPIFKVTDLKDHFVFYSYYVTEHHQVFSKNIAECIIKPAAPCSPPNPDYMTTEEMVKRFTITGDRLVDTKLALELSIENHKRRKAWIELLPDEREKYDDVGLACALCCLAKQTQACDDCVIQDEHGGACCWVFHKAQVNAHHTDDPKAFFAWEDQLIERMQKALGKVNEIISGQRDKKKKDSPAKPQASSPEPLLKVGDWATCDIEPKNTFKITRIEITQPDVNDRGKDMLQYGSDKADRFCRRYICRSATNQEILKALDLAVGTWATYEGKIPKTFKISIIEDKDNMPGTPLITGKGLGWYAAKDCRTATIPEICDAKDLKVRDSVRYPAEQKGEDYYTITGIEEDGLVLSPAVGKIAAHWGVHPDKVKFLGRPTDNDNEEGGWLMVPPQFRPMPGESVMYNDFKWKVKRIDESGYTLGGSTISTPTILGVALKNLSPVPNNKQVKKSDS